MEVLKWLRSQLGHEPRSSILPGQHSTKRARY